MRGDVDPNAAPFRTLGLEPGASMAEVKRAYRLLAKAFHPDSAGEAAVSRFLAVQAAYEQLKGGGPVSNATAQRPPNQPAAEPWRADPARARAARERARTARNGPARGAGASGAGASGAGPSGTGGTAGAAGASGGFGSTTGTSASGARGSGRRRAARKATMGSTSYDEARDPSDATWSGASWYGGSSGEYWIVNPREYADPRKHGPEYQQRARRPLGADASPEPAVGATGATAAPAAEADPPPPGGTPWKSTAGGPSGNDRAARTARAEPVGGPWRAVSPDRTPFRPGEATPEVTQAEAIDVAGHARLGGPADEPVRRLGLALLAWPPIGLAAAVVVGELTGCATYAAACVGVDPMLPWLAQAVILGLLLLLPPVTRLLANGAVAVILALVPITAFLLAVGGAGEPQAGPVLAILLLVAWVGGIAWSATGLRRRTVARAGR